MNIDLPTRFFEVDCLKQHYFLKKKRTEISMIVEFTPLIESQIMEFCFCRSLYTLNQLREKTERMKVVNFPLPIISK